MKQSTMLAALLLTPLAGLHAADPAIVARPTEAKLLLMGNWADPSILKDGDDYYLTHSSFEFQPGLLVWHSKDLRSWRPISRAVTNQPGSIWAPDMIKYAGQFSIYYPASGGNFVVTARSPYGPWSDPRSLDVGHIDPGHVVGPDGQRYLHLSGGCAVGLAPDGLRAVGKPQRIYEGWPIPPDWAIECFCLESPKLTRRGAWYYLTSAQGGTAGPATSHMVVSARSRGPLGPWENSPFNPIIRTWDREETWWSKGHGTLVEGPGGQWYCVLHGYRNGYRSLGRCTLIEPIQWTADGWFKVSERWPTGWERAVSVEMPMSDQFQGPQLGIQWQFFQKYDPKRLAFTDGGLVLQAAGTTPGDSFPLCVMPLHRAYEIETEVEMDGAGAAGLMLFFSPNAYLGLAVDQAGQVMRVQNAFERFARGPVPQPGRRRVTLRIVNNKQDVLAYCRDAVGHWQPVPPALEISGADHNTLGGWHCVRPALFACGAGQARFRSFTYRPLE
jgi:xylan 1,4-beta-xylosidase